jgi:hypothetical protein
MKSVIILCKGIFRGDCPFDTDETWGINNVFMKPEFEGKKFDKLFIADDNSLSRGWVEEAKKRNIPIISIHDFATEKFPLNQVIERFKTGFFSNTVCYAVAYALYHDYKKIRMYGAQMKWESEYVNEKGGLEFWIGIAKGMAISEGRDPNEALWISPPSDLLRTRNGEIYGLKQHYKLPNNFWTPKNVVV